MPNRGTGAGNGQLHAGLLAATIAGILVVIYLVRSISPSQRVPIALATSSLAVVIAFVLGLVKKPAVRSALTLGTIWLGMLAMLLFYLAHMLVGTVLLELAYAIVSLSSMKIFKR